MKRLLAALALLALAAAASAQPYPSKPVRFVVATGAGGSDDFTARQVAAKLSEILGQQVIVENRPGAGGMIAQTSVAKSAPDGYTVLLAGGSMAGARYVNLNVTYDLLKDFTPISLLTTFPFALLVNPTLPVKDLKEFIALGRARPGKLTYATLGAGQIPYWGALMFNAQAGIDALEIVYKNPSDVMTDLITGRVDYAIFGILNAVTNKERLKVLAMTTRVRSELMPEVPTMAETTLPNYDMPAWQSMMGPPGMNPENVQILNKAVVRAVAATCASA
jgi:tripartite-type tricarboxylate transporter receptor subunit TctC